MGDSREFGRAFSCALRPILAVTPMKTLFPGHLRPSNEHLEKLFKTDALFVFDTNCLLHLYRYSETASSELLRTLKAVEQRIWVPNQAAKEFLANRIEVISSQQAAYKDFQSTLNKCLESLESPREHPFISIEKLGSLRKLIGEIEQELNDGITKHDKLITDDHLMPAVFDLLDGKVGEPLSEVELNQLYKDGEQRYEKQIPPGFKDKSKPAPIRYGDLILWFQVIRHAKTVSKPIILISDDGKEDWWLRPKGKTIGPRPELVAEMKQKASVDFYMYSPFQFLSHANRLLKLQITKETIQEVQHTVAVTHNFESTLPVKNSDIRPSLCLQTAHALLQSLERLVETDGLLSARGSFESQHYLSAAEEQLRNLPQSSTALITWKQLNVLRVCISDYLLEGSPNTFLAVRRHLQELLGRIAAAALHFQESEKSQPSA